MSESGVLGEGEVSCGLQPVNLHDRDEYGILRSQRRACGWYYETAYLDRWKASIDAGTKCLFWITIPSPEAPNHNILAGHISLDSTSEFPDRKFELANPDKSLLTVTTFFVLQQYRGRALGRKAMERVEEMVKTEPYGSSSCTAITMMSLSRKYVADPTWRAQYFQWTGEEPTSYEDWYSRMGYVKWKEEPCTEGVGRDGDAYTLVEAFMKKCIG